MILEWTQWTMDNYHPDECGGHSFRHSSTQATDQKRKAEKAFLSSGKWQVAHAHDQNQRCGTDCEVIGHEQP